jgi:hypothetical protein
MNTDARTDNDCLNVKIATGSLPLESEGRQTILTLEDTIPLGEQFLGPGAGSKCLQHYESEADKS